MRPQWRTLLAGSSFGSSEDPRLHIGLGAAAQVDAVEVHWPSGAVEIVRDLPARHLVVIEEGKGAVARLPPPFTGTTTKRCARPGTAPGRREVQPR